MRILGHWWQGTPHRDTAPGVLLPLTPPWLLFSRWDGPCAAPRAGSGMGTGDRTGSPLSRDRSGTGSSLCPDRNRTRAPRYRSRTGPRCPQTATTPGLSPRRPPAPVPIRDGVPAVLLLWYRTGRAPPCLHHPRTAPVPHPVVSSQTPPRSPVCPAPGTRVSPAPGVPGSVLSLPPVFPREPLIPSGPALPRFKRIAGVYGAQLGEPGSGSIPGDAAGPGSVAPGGRIAASGVWERPRGDVQPKPHPEDGILPGVARLQLIQVSGDGNGTSEASRPARGN